MPYVAGCRLLLTVMGKANEKKKERARERERNRKEKNIDYNRVRMRAEVARQCDITRGSPGSPVRGDLR